MEATLYFLLLRLQAVVLAVLVIIFRLVTEVLAVAVNLELVVVELMVLVEQEFLVKDLRVVEDM
jgi:hypothetical protein